MNYEKLDSLIFERVRESKKPLWTVSLGPLVMGEAKRIADTNNRQPYRVIDGRMQALRKKGVIKYEGGGWVDAQMTLAAERRSAL